MASRAKFYLQISLRHLLFDTQVPVPHRQNTTNTILTRNPLFPVECRLVQHPCSNSTMLSLIPLRRDFVRNDSKLGGRSKRLHRDCSQEIFGCPPPRTPSLFPFHFYLRRLGDILFFGRCYFTLHGLHIVT
jgi:hypothetical protein